MMAAGRRPSTTEVAAAATVVALGVVLGLIAGAAPPVAIGVAIALAFAAVVITNLSAGLLLFVFVIYLESLLPAGALTLTKVVGLLLAISWLARITTRREENNFLLANPAATFLVAAFCGWVVLSLTWAQNIPAGLQDTQRYLLNIALYVIVFSAVRTENQARAVLWAIVAGTALTAILGFAVGPTATAASDARLDSTVGNSNQLAAALIAGLAISGGVGLSRATAPAAKPVAMAVAGLALFTLVLTGSRSGVIALGVVLIGAIVFGGRWRPQIFLASAATAITVFTLFVAFAPAPVRDRITEITPGEVRASQEGRVTIWQVAERMVADNPVLGVGVGNFQERSIDYVLEPGTAGRTDQIVDDPQVAHNTYLHVLAEMGIVGAVPFLLILGFSCWAALAAARGFERAGNEGMEVLSRALLVALLGVLAADFFASEQFSKLLWLLLGLGPALLAISRSGPMQPSGGSADRRAEPRGPQPGGRRLAQPVASAYSRS